MLASAAHLTFVPTKVGSGPLRVWVSLKVIAAQVATGIAAIRPKINFAVVSHASRLAQIGGAANAS